MKTSLLHSDYDKQIGLSTVALGSKHGIFWGSSTLMEEDKKYESEIRGCEYAETKAYVKILRAELKEQKAQLKGMMNLYKAMCNYKDTDPVTMHYISKQINVQKTRVEKVKEEIQIIENGLKKRFESDVQIINKIRKSFNKSDK